MSVYFVRSWVYFDPIDSSCRIRVHFRLWQLLNLFSKVRKTFTFVGLRFRNTASAAFLPRWPAGPVVMCFFHCKCFFQCVVTWNIVYTFEACSGALCASFPEVIDFTSYVPRTPPDQPRRVHWFLLPIVWNNVGEPSETDMFMNWPPSGLLWPLFDELGTVGYIDITFAFLCTCPDGATFLWSWKHSRTAIHIMLLAPVQSFR